MPLWALVWVKNARRCLHWRPTEADIVVPPSERIQKQELEEGDPIMTSSFRAIPSWTNGTSMKMATTGQKWETVGKSNKKSKPNGSTGNKQQRKSLRDNMPKLDVAAPVKETPTIYEAFLEKEQKEQKVSKSAKDQGKATANGDAGKKQTQPRKKQGGEKKKESPLSLDEALKRVEVDEMKTVLEKDMSTFPENPSVWLKDLASMLNVRLDNVSEPDPVFEGKPKDYPMSALNKSVQMLIRKTMSQCSIHVLEVFLEHCIQAMINDMAKGISTYGYRIFIQLLALDKPEIFMSGLGKYLEMVRQHQNRSLRCLSIMWAVGQAGNCHLSNGLKIWLEVMLPVINIRSLSKYAVDYLESMFTLHKNLKSAYGVLNFRNFFPILDLIFVSHSNLPTTLQKKLLALYPKIRTVSFGKSPETNLRNFFPIFLARLSPNCNKNLKTELLSSLVECLVVDKQCYSVWRQMYTKNLDQSGILLNYLMENWDNVQKRVEQKQLRETIRAFSITNEELSAQGKSGGDGYKACVSACKEGVRQVSLLHQDLLLKMSSMKFPWRMVIFMTVTLFGGIIIYDAYVHKGFKKSKTAKILQDAGLLNFLEQVWNRIRVYSSLAFVWLQENVPYYYAKACAFVGPYFQLCGEKLHDAGVYLMEVSKPQRDWLAEKIPQGLAWVQSHVPGLLDALSFYGRLTWDYTVYVCLWLWTHVVHAVQVSGTWLQENVFTGKLSYENLQQTATSGLTAIQGYTSALFQWCAKLINTKTD